MDDPCGLLPRGADFKPSAILLVFPFQGESSMRGSFAVGHFYGLARLQVRVNMLLFRGAEIVVELANTHRLVMPRIQPVEGFRQERNRRKRSLGHSDASAHDLPCRKNEPSGRFFRAPAAPCRLRGMIVARQCVDGFPELPPQRFAEEVGLPVRGGNLVLAVGFPIPKAPIALAHLPRGVAAVQPPDRSPAAGAAAQALRCIFQNRSCSPLRLGVDAWQSLPDVFVPA